MRRLDFCLVFVGFELAELRRTDSSVFRRFFLAGSDGEVDDDIEFARFEARRMEARCGTGIPTWRPA